MAENELPFGGRRFRMARALQQMMNGMKRLKALIAAQQKREREAQATADARNAAGRFGTRLRAVVEENGRPVLATAEMLRANEQLAADVVVLPAPKATAPARKPSSGSLPPNVAHPAETNKEIPFI
jgi:hypothetical protein